MQKLKLLIILGSVRDGRRGKLVADWFLPIAKSDERFEVNLLDLADLNMPLNIGETEPSERKDKKYPVADVQKLSDAVDKADAILFITPEYNHAIPASVKNAIDQIYWEWLDKIVGFIGYGTRGGPDAIDSLRHTSRVLRWKQIQPSLGIEKVKQAFDEKGQMLNTDYLNPKAHEFLDNIFTTYKNS